MPLRLLLLAVLKLTLIEAKKEFGPTIWPLKYLAMVWVDGRNRLDNKEIDTFFDRVVSLAYTNPQRSSIYSNEATGVLISDQHILSTFNPFRTLSLEEGGLTKIKFTIVTHRLFNLTDFFTTYFIVRQRTLVCARQVHPPRHDDPEVPHMNHGTHNPAHDLMVWRLNKKIDILKPPPPRVHEFLNIHKGKWESVHKAHGLLMGPVLTKLAKPGDAISENLQFASIGHINEEHIAEGRFLEKEEIPANDNVIADCDEWFPREWGHFICLLNVNNYPGISSGAVLFSGDLLIGLGAFALFRGKTSILVFTDIRPYYDLIYHTCTEDDQNLVTPKFEL